MPTCERGLQVGKIAKRRGHARQWRLDRERLGLADALQARDQEIGKIHHWQQRQRSPGDLRIQASPALSNEARTRRAHARRQAQQHGGVGHLGQPCNLRNAFHCKPMRHAGTVPAFEHFVQRTQHRFAKLKFGGQQACRLAGLTGPVVAQIRAA